jgi:hypothetical protein
MQERIIGFVEENSNMPPKLYRKMMMNTGELVMDMGTVLAGKQAVEVGLIDRMGGLSDAVDCLYTLIEDDKARREEEEKEKAKEAGLTMENMSEVADPTEYMRSRQGKKAKDHDRRARPRRSRAAHQVAAFRSHTQEPHNSRDIAVTNGAMQIPGDTDAHSDPQFPPLPAAGHYGGIRPPREAAGQPGPAQTIITGEERPGDLSPQTQDRHTPPETAHTMEQWHDPTPGADIAHNPPPGYGGDTPPAVNPFGHPGARGGH